MAKGMILAAGQGTRVRPLTKDLPKPMVPILGKPVMEYLIEHLVRHGITEIMVNVAYHHQRIEQYFGDGSRWGRRSAIRTRGCASMAISCRARWAQQVGCERSKISVDFSTRPPWFCAVTHSSTWTLRQRWQSTSPWARWPAFWRSRFQ